MSPLTQIRGPQRARHIWEILFPYIGAILLCVGVILLLLAAISRDWNHIVSEVLRDVGLAFLPLGMISLVFEGVARRHYLSSLRDVVGEGVDQAISRIAESTVDKIVDQAFTKRLTIDMEALAFIRGLRTMGLERVMTRSELEVSDISFVNVTRSILSKAKNDKEFFVVGRSLDFVAKQIDTLEYGLRNGVAFRFLIADEPPTPWLRKATQVSRANAISSVQKLKGLLFSADRTGWTGSLEVRRLHRGISTSFSSYVQGGKRVSVINYDIGDELHLRWAQVFVNEAGDRSFPEHLYLMNKALFEEGYLTLSFPSELRFVYIYGIRANEVLFVRKQGSAKWELPGGEIEPHETYEEAVQREFREETGLSVHVVSSLPPTEHGKLAFVGLVEEGKLKTQDAMEIAELAFYPMDRIPAHEFLSFPETGYRSVLDELSRRFSKGA